MAMLHMKNESQELAYCQEKLSGWLNYLEDREAVDRLKNFLRTAMHEFYVAHPEEVPAANDINAALLEVIVDSEHAFDDAEKVCDAKQAAKDSLASFNVLGGIPVEDARYDVPNN
jgi:hypothetical protein